MTLHEIAEQLRKVAYDMDEASRKWDANDRHVLKLNTRIADLEMFERTARGGRLAAEEALAKAEAKLKRLRLRKRAK